jgi:hypothetical protein
MNKGLVIVVIMLILVGGIYFYSENASGTMITSPSGIGGAGSLWGQEFIVEYEDGTSRALNLGLEQFAVFHEGKEVVSIRYRLSAMMTGVTENVIVSLLGYKLTFAIDGQSYILNFDEDGLVIPVDKWQSLTSQEIPIENITGGLSSGTYRIDIVPGGSISYKIGYVGGVTTATLPIPVTDNLVITSESIFYTLTITVIGEGSTDPVSGGSYESGTIVDVEATPDIGNHFVSWSGAAQGVATTCSVEMDGDKTLIAQFVTDVQSDHSLYVTTVGQGSVDILPINDGPYPYGTSVTLTPQAFTGWAFSAWGGEASGSTIPLQINMTKDWSIQATFVTQQYSLGITIDPVGSGTVSQQPAPPYGYNQVVTLTAQPNLGSSFVQWTGDATGTNLQTTVTMVSSKSVTAHFSQEEYTLSTSISPLGAGSISIVPSGPYNYNDVVTLTATPIGAYGFVSWSEGGTVFSTTRTTSYTVTGDATIQATFSSAFIIVSQPDGTEPLTQEESFLVEWFYNFNDNVDINLYTSSFVFVQSLVSDTVDDGSWSWLVSQPVGSYIVQVSRHSPAGVSGNSAIFTIEEGTTNGLEDFMSYNWYPVTYLSRTTTQITATGMPRFAECYSQKAQPSIGTNAFTIEFDIIATQLDFPDTVGTISSPTYGGNLCTLFENLETVHSQSQSQSSKTGVAFRFCSLCTGVGLYSYGVQFRDRTANPPTGHWFDYNNIGLNVVYHVVIQRTSLSATNGWTISMYTGWDGTTGTPVSTFPRQINSGAADIQYVLPMVGRGDSIEGAKQGSGSVSNMKITIG